MPDIQTQLAAKLRDGDDRERCGFVTRAGKVVEVPNIAQDPSQQFKMDPKTVLEHVRKGATATWHTHTTTDANLSGEDYACFLNWDDLLHYVIGRRNGTVRVKSYAVENGLVVQQ